MSELTPKIEAELVKLDRLLTQLEGVQWQIGDLLVQLVDVESIKLKDIASRYEGQPGRSYTRLSEHYNNAKAFPPEARRTDLNYSAHEDYWDKVVERICDSNWWNSPEPSVEIERRIWQSRAAFLDVRFYEK